MFLTKRVYEISVWRSCWPEFGMILSAEFPYNEQLISIFVLLDFKEQIGLNDCKLYG